MDPPQEPDALHVQAAPIGQLVSQSAQTSPAPHAAVLVPGVHVPAFWSEQHPPLHGWAEEHAVVHVAVAASHASPTWHAEELEQPASVAVSAPSPRLSDAASRAASAEDSDLASSCESAPPSLPGESVVTVPPQAIAKADGRSREKSKRTRMPACSRTLARGSTSGQGGKSHARRAGKDQRNEDPTGPTDRYEPKTRRASPSRRLLENDRSVVVYNRHQDVTRNWSWLR
jgi:hypothetical protein